MPLQIQRTATVYRLWDSGDVTALFEAHAADGWVCQTTCHKDGDSLTWVVSLQKSDTRQLVTATLSDVVVSDLVTVYAQTVGDYNAANPDQPIEEGS